MNSGLRGRALPIQSSLDCSSRRREFHAAGPVIGFVLAALTLALTPQISSAGTSTVTGYSDTAVTSKVPTIPGQGLHTDFTASTYSDGPYLFVAYPFTVSVTGVYEATAYTTTAQNTTYFTKGLFSATSHPPVTDFLALYYASSTTNSVYLATFPALTLVAGQQYTALVAYASATGGEPSTVTITGPGCIAIGSNTCVAPVPTLSEWAVFLLAALLLAMGAWHIRRTQRV